MLSSILLNTASFFFRAVSSEAKNINRTIPSSLPATKRAFILNDEYLVEQLAVIKISPVMLPVFDLSADLLTFGVCRQPILSAEVSMLRIWFESKFFNKDSRMFS